MQSPTGSQPGDPPPLAQPYLSPTLDSSHISEAGLYNFTPPSSLPPFLYLEQEQGWLLSRHEDIKALLSDERFKTQHPPLPTKGASKKLASMLGKNLEHGAIKTLMNDPACRTLFLEKVKASSEKAATQKLANIATHKKLGSPFQYAYGAANRTIAALFQIPERNLAVFIRFARAYIDLKTQGKNLSDEELFHAHEHLAIGLELLGTITIDAFDALPGREHISDEDFIFGLLTGTLAGGLDLAIRLITGGIHLCTRNEGERNKLIEGALWDRLPVEVYRYFSPTSTILPKIATRNCSLNGQAIKKGEKLYPLIAAANRDKRLFANPGKFDIGRDNHDVIFYDPDDSATGHLFALATAETALRHYFQAQQFPR